MTPLQYLEQRIENDQAFVRVERENVARSFAAIAATEAEIEQMEEAVKKLKGDER